MSLSGTVLSVGNWRACVTPYHVPVIPCCTLNPTLKKKLACSSKILYLSSELLHGTTSPRVYSHCSPLWYGQVKIYLFLMKPHVMKMCGEAEIRVLHVCNFGSRWSWVVNFEPWQLNPFDETDRRLGGSQEPDWIQGKISCPCQELKTKFFFIQSVASTQHWLR